MMAAGLITIAHASAGPKQDIIGGSKEANVGYLASNEQEYTNYVVKAMCGYSDDYHKNVVQAAKKWVTDAFGIETFES